MAFVGLFEVFLAVICFFNLHYFANNNKKKNGFPTNFPLVGMLPALLLNVHRIHDYSTQILERSQCTFLFKGPWFANMDILVLNGIFNSDSDSWKNQRKFLLKTSRNKVENGMIPILENVSKQGISMDLQDLFQRFTFDSTCIMVTAYDPGCLSVEFLQVLFSRALEDAEESIFYHHVVPKSLWKLQRWLGIEEEKKMKRAKKILDQTIVGYIQRKREELSQEIGLNKQMESEGEDLITSYMNEDKDKTNGLRSDDQFLRDTILNFMIAGRDTTGSALTGFFWLVSKNSKVETRIREELESIIPNGKSGKWWEFDIKELHKLAYLHGAICEALRLYPPVPFQHKAPVKPEILPSGHRVVPSTKILFSLYVLGIMKSIWGEDCLKFKPERWKKNYYISII
ncbi:hypothetical protein ACOSP7_022020 [Xanthoceras sorbifolium]